MGKSKSRPPVTWTENQDGIYPRQVSHVTAANTPEEIKSVILSAAEKWNQQAAETLEDELQRIQSIAREAIQSGSYSSRRARRNRSALRNMVSRASDLSACSVGRKRTGNRSCPHWRRIPWKDRPVYIVFDSDIATNEDVQDAEARLAAHLKNRGAKVKVCRIPEGPAAHGRQADETGNRRLLVAQAAGLDPKKAIRDLLDAAEEPTPPSAIEIKRPQGNRRRARGRLLLDEVPNKTAFPIAILAADRGCTGHTQPMPRFRRPRPAPNWSSTSTRRFSSLTSSVTSNVMDC